MLNYSDLITLISVQMQRLIDNEPKLEGFKFKVANEQQFQKEKIKDPTTTYMVVRFAQGNETFAYTSVPFTIVAMGEANGIEKTQLLLMSYTTHYNLTRVEEQGIAQSYNTPNVVSNFNLVSNGLRSLFYVAGTFLYSELQNYIQSITVGGEPLNFLTAQIGYSATPEPASFWEEGGYTRSFIRQGTLTLNVVGFLLNETITNKALLIALKQGDINDTFVMTIEFKNGIKAENLEFKLIDFSSDQKLVEIPGLSMTFST